MKKLFRALIPCLLCSAMLAAFAGCGYDVEGLVPHGEKGSMMFLGVNYNESNSLSEGVKVEINFAHETAAQTETAYSVYVGADGAYQSVSRSRSPLPRARSTTRKISKRTRSSPACSRTPAPSRRARWRSDFPQRCLKRVRAVSASSLQARTRTFRTNLRCTRTTSNTPKTATR